MNFCLLLLLLQLMNLLFSFLAPDRSHSTLLAGYFSKVYSLGNFEFLVCDTYNSCMVVLKHLLYDNFCLILQVVICLMIRKTVPLMNYVQVSKPM